MALGIEIAGFGAAPADGLLALSKDPDVQQLLDRSGVRAQANALIAQHGGDVRALLKNSGVDVSQIASQAGLPPGISDAIFKVGAAFRAKGVEGKIGGAADAAQQLVDQASGVAGQVGAVATNVLTRVVKLRLHAAGKVGGAGGSAVGMAILGPAGAAIGRVAGTFVGEGVRAAGKALGIEGAAAKRKDRERQREKDDAGRYAAFVKAYPQARTPAGLHDLFIKGQVVMSHGVIGSQKPEERNDFAIVAGKYVGHLSQQQQASKWSHVLGRKGSMGPWVLYLTSNKWTEDQGGKLLDYEKKQQAAAQAQLDQVKSTLASALTQAATASPAAPAARRQKRRPVPAPAPAPTPSPSMIARPKRRKGPKPRVVAVASGLPALVEPSYDDLVKIFQV